MSNKVKLKGHESFSIREGWLSKGIFEIKNDPGLFSRKDLTDVLGIGTNMVKSLKYWLQTANLIEESKKNEYKLSELGRLIEKHDPFLEHVFTLYFVHLNIVRNKDKAYIWNLFFNKCNLKNFSKRVLVEHMKSLLNMEDLEYNENILIDEISVLLKTYMIDERNDTPENNFTCPLAELNLVRKNFKDNYSKEKPVMDNLDELIVYYLILEQGNESLNIEDLLKEDNSVGKLLNLDKMILNEYLEILKRRKFITINRTAGLNMIYINKKMDLPEIFKEYFRKD